MSDNDYELKFCSRCDSYRGYVCAEHREPSYGQLQQRLTAAEGRCALLDEILDLGEWSDGTHGANCPACKFAARQRDAAVKILGRKEAAVSYEQPKDTDGIIVDLQQRLAKAETLAVKRWTDEHQSALDRILQSHIDDVNQRLTAARDAAQWMYNRRWEMWTLAHENELLRRAPWLAEPSGNPGALETE